MGDLLTLICPSCGGKLEVNGNESALVCKHCGSEHLIQRDGGSVTLESFARCPKCGRNDRVEKVSVILRSHSKDTGLVTNLAKPIPPVTDPKPEPLLKPELPPEPDLKPKPKPIPKPILLPKPKIFIRKPKVIFLLIGLVLLLVTYVFALTSLGILIDEFEILTSLCAGIFAIVTTLFSALFIYLGLSAKKEITDSDQTIEELINRFDQTTFSFTSVIIPILFFFLSGGCLLLLLVGGVFRESFVTIAMILALGFIPSIIGLYILAMKYMSVKINKKNIDILHNQNTKIDEWEYVNSSIVDAWKDKNQALLDNWETENSQIQKNWQTEKSKLLQEWEQANSSLMKKWEEKQAETLSNWYRANTRWEKLYFCHRDDIVFIPGEGSSAPTERIQDYLLRGED